MCVCVLQINIASDIVMCVFILHVIILLEICSELCITNVGLTVASGVCPQFHQIF